ncbi:conserved Plasmodium protein, unknown function [Plasmodium berghei]|uniref:Uncharacterized protein n=3 Tax=Plasmodium berghei TaxID=5821 RepID=A0A509AH73_PLABA|nr:conserved Plasmodium protein, unknown function [Plasmodium berghei ANKA]CXI19232.1 conserved Plasmodium protein, unknown function [Plasmodium berghei]SCM19832.1 conserved Plasmodium protein, unknown function [Plasmodium berghei]SCN23572.1 conserved Plasmodium protein, unknown function [Plasmodium berghei]SCO59908.1 conserved Plasmodium protein, unknown function [Plasmodium berghei]VUC54837.1 conserved Plasmodium protein, unknown function [Plasmodium berghei ANKA]|eukprot:XP_034420662.1 conserved Plasmodium protein, unknown function [Plasmodium berghei ANKA]
MIGVNHDFLSGNFLGYPLEENNTICYKNLRLNKKKENLKTPNYHEDYLVELNELKEYKRLASQKIKKYENCVYSYKNQIRNLKSNTGQVKNINIQLIDVFINAICDIIEHICLNIHKPVLHSLPLIHTILTSISIRDKKIYQCTKLIHIILTKLNSEHVVRDNGSGIKEEENGQMGLTSHKLQDLEWLSSETNDKGWLAIVDRWELCKRDLKWLCVKTNNRSWLLYRHLWEKSSNDLKYIAVLFDDKKWLHLCNIWNSVPLSIKLKAISLKDPSICQPTLREIMLNDDDVYKNNTISALSEILNIANLENNYLISQSNHRESNNSLRYIDHTYKHFTGKKNLEIFPEKVQIMKGSILEELLADNINGIDRINCKEHFHRNSVTTAEKLSEIKQIDESNDSKEEKCDEKKTQKENAGSIEKKNFITPLKDVPKSFLKSKNIEKSGYIRKKNYVPLKFIEKYKNKNPMEQKISTKKSETNVVLNNKNDLTCENTIGKITKMNKSKSGFNSKLILKKSSETNIYKNGITVKAGVDKDVMRIESLDKQDVTINKTIEETGTEKITEENNNIISEIVKNNRIKKSVKPLGEKIPQKINTGLKGVNMNNDISLIEKKNVNFSKLEKIVKNPILFSVKNLTKVKETTFEKKNISLKKGNLEKNICSSEGNCSENSDTTNNNINTQVSNTSLSEKCGEKKSENEFKTSQEKKKENPMIYKLLKLKEQNGKKCSITLKKNSNHQSNETNGTSKESRDLNENDIQNKAVKYTNSAGNSQRIKSSDSVGSIGSIDNDRKEDDSSEDEVKVDTTCKNEETAKQDVPNNVTNYITDLFSAFNFVNTKVVSKASKEVHNIEKENGENNFDHHSGGDNKTTVKEENKEDSGKSLKNSWTSDNSSEEDSTYSKKNYIYNKKEFSKKIKSFEYKKSSISEVKDTVHFNEEIKNRDCVETKKSTSAAFENIHNDINNEEKCVKAKRNISLRTAKYNTDSIKDKFLRKTKRSFDVEHKLYTNLSESKLEDNNKASYINELGKNKNSNILLTHEKRNIIVKGLNIKREKPKLPFLGKNINNIEKKN